MGRFNGSEVLERELGHLVEQIVTVQASVSTVSSGGAGSGNRQIESSFASAATYVAGTLADVSDRLRRLDELLGHLKHRA